MKIKVCGMRDGENIRQLMALKPDYIGFIFYAPSKRFAGAMNEELLNVIPPDVKRTGVFVNAEAEEVLEKIKKYALQAVQLHGNETPEFCERIKKEPVEVIKAFGIDQNFDFDVLTPYQKAVDFFLFDTKTKNHGGSGKTFNWDYLNRYKLSTAYFLSGGLGPENLLQVQDIKDERLYALDLNSRFETSPGLKDMDKLRKAFLEVKS